MALVVGILGMALYQRHQRSFTMRLDTPMIGTAAYAAWGLVCAMAMLWEGRVWNEEVAKQCVRLLELVAVMWLASETIRSRSLDLGLVVLLSVGIACWGIFYSELMYRDHLSATMAAIVLPLALNGVIHFRHPAVKILLGLATFKLLAIVYVGESRSAIAGLAAGITVYGLLSSYRWWLLICSFLTALPAWLLIRRSQVVHRFEAIWNLQTGWDSGRLEVWKRAWNTFQVHPLFGEGTGTASSTAADVHSTYLTAMSETGAVGFLLYLLIWSAIVASLVGSIWRHGERWPGSTAKALLAATIGQLVIGFGYSLHSLLLAFLIGGWALALGKWPRATSAVQQHTGIVPVIASKLPPAVELASGTP